MTIAINGGDIYTDVSSLRNLKREAAQGSSQALEKTAEQFEALFLQMMLKSMRQSSSGDGMFESDQTRFYQQMFDQQIAIDMAKKRQIGIADMLVKKLGKDKVENDVPLNSATNSVSGPSNYVPQDLIKPQVVNMADKVSAVELSAPFPADTVSKLSIELKISPVQSSRIEKKSFDSPNDFIEELTPLAEKYAAELGVDPRVLLAQSALETGWGKKINRDMAGVSSYNLFNIKADQRWSGDKVMVSTLEYENGRPMQQRAVFRSYPNFEESFKDYVRFLKSNPRYQQALSKASDGAAFVRSLHEAGYATDPRYSAKITTIMRSDLLSDLSQKI